jgi:glycosyltransferase involved in cell wall biosynthesis
MLGSVFLPLGEFFVQKVAILINGLSIGSGGGFTVGIELFRHLAEARPSWRLVLALISGNPLHEEAKRLATPPNCELLWAPPDAARVLARAAYERGTLKQRATETGVSAILQLNGMVIPDLGIPTLAHCQDPWPYRHEAWDGRADAVKAFLKRRAHRRAFQRAAFVSWTSGYLRDLMCSRLGITPQRGAVIYNGIPDEWIVMAENAMPTYAERPLRIVTISNVNRYKQQEMVIRAMPALIRTPGLEGLRYHIAGHCPPEEAARLQGVAESLGVSASVAVEGRVSRDRVVELFKTARCFVLMSKCESFGIPAIEAMAFGTPVVAADCCAIPEVCGSAAELSGIDDLSGLVESIKAVLLHPSRAETLREEGVKNIRRFRWRESAGQLAGAVEAVLGTGARP